MNVPSHPWSSGCWLPRGVETPARTVGQKLLMVPSQSAPSWGSSLCAYPNFSPTKIEDYDKSPFSVHSSPANELRFL